MASRKVKKKTTVKKKPASKKETAIRRRAPGMDVSVICINRDCKLRKKKSCKGFEGCPGFKGR